jgi:hypothetical protein
MKNSQLVPNCKVADFLLRVHNFQLIFQNDHPFFTHAPPFSAWGYEKSPTALLESLSSFIFYLIQT